MASIKLPEFWKDAPVAWFGSVEAQFRLRNVIQEVDKFCLLTAALDKETTKQVVHLIVDPDTAAPYSKLKEALLTSHLITDFQRVELLLAIDSLGGRKPSQLLAEMLELCPREEHTSKLFAALFLQRLPRDIRVLLAQDDHTDLRKLATKADQLTAFHKQQPHDVSAVASEDIATIDLVAAVKKEVNWKKRTQQTGNKPPLPPPRKREGPPPPLQLAQQASGLCWYHWRFGEGAKKCSAPCSWTGTKN